MFDDVFQEEGIDALIVPGQRLGDVENGHVQIHPTRQAIDAATELDVEWFFDGGGIASGFVCMKSAGERGDDDFVAGVGAIEAGKVFFGPVEPVEREVHAVFEAVGAAASCSRAAIVSPRIELQGVVPVGMAAMSSRRLGS